MLFLLMFKLHEDYTMPYINLGDLVNIVRTRHIVYFRKGQDYSTVDDRSKRKCYWTRATCDCGRLQIGDVTREVEVLSNDYTNPNTNPKTFTTLAHTLADHHDAFECFLTPVFCDFVRNYSCTVDGAVVTSFRKTNRIVHFYLFVRDLGSTRMPTFLLWFVLNL